MVLLSIGILLFAGVHLIPSLAPQVKLRWRNRLGGGGYRGIFSLLLLASFALIITGWRNTLPVFIYQPSSSLRGPALTLILLAFVLMAASIRNSHLRLVIRHPQLTGVSLWGLGHLLLNGDSRSLLLFGGMTLWAVVEMFAINRREGLWIKGEAPPWSSEVVNLLIAAVAVALVIYLHPWLAGVAVTVPLRQ